MQQIGERRNAHQERAIVTWNGFAALAIGLMLLAAGVWQLLRGLPYGGPPSFSGLLAAVLTFVVLFMLGLFIAAERGGDSAAFRQLSRQLPGPRPAWHQSFLQPAQDVAARPQSQRRAAQG